MGPNDLQSKDQPTPLPPKTAEAPKAPKRVVQGPHYYDRAPQPLQAFIDTVMLPFDFLSYPGAEIGECGFLTRLHSTSHALAKCVVG